VDDSENLVKGQESLASLVRQHEVMLRQQDQRLTRLEVRYEEMDRRFGELHDTLRELRNDFAEYRRESSKVQAFILEKVNGLSVKLAAVAAGSTIIVNIALSRFGV
jgi:predicted RNase H-like nuclease (RuvC/YqgF family)